MRTQSGCVDALAIAPARATTAFGTSGGPISGV